MDILFKYDLDFKLPNRMPSDKVIVGILFSSNSRDFEKHL